MLLENGYWKKNNMNINKKELIESLRRSSKQNKAISEAVDLALEK